MPDMVSQFEKALLSMDILRIKQLVSEATANQLPLHFAENVVTPALERIGQAWQAGSVALSQVYMAGRISEQVVEDILPPASSLRKDQPRMAITVLGDYHLLGKRMVYAVVRAAGYQISDFGRTEADELVTRIRQEGIKIILISTLMLPSALRIKDVRRNLNDHGSDVKIVVGGAPFLMDAQLWREVGADAMGKSASDAVQVVSGIMEAAQ